VVAMNAKKLYTLAQGLGINPFAATCQSAHETGHWSSVLWQNAKNGAGIKAGTTWLRADKPVYKVLSREYEGGSWTTRESLFRQYASVEEFLADYADKIRLDYPESWASADNWPGYFAGLYKGRWGAWATDPAYFKKLVKMAIKLAPDLLGEGWASRLKLAANLARTRGSLNDWQEEVMIECSL
jgi:flagellum-specific peptidoglycan hydrolase FlgJ